MKYGFVLSIYSFVVWSQGIPNLYILIILSVLKSSDRNPHQIAVGLE